MRWRITLLLFATFCHVSYPIITELCILHLVKVGVERRALQEKMHHLSKSEKVQLKELLGDLREFPDRVITEKEKKLLEKLGLTQKVNQLHALGKKFGKGIQFYMFAGAGMILGSLGLNFVGETYVPNAECDKDVPAESEIDLIFHSPMPHMALRIGHTYYDFTAGGNRGVYSEKEFKKSNEDTRYLNSTRIRLTLNKDDIQSLQADLQNKKNEKFTYTPASHCVSELNGAIESHCQITIPAGIDHAPFYTKSWFKLKRALGSNQVSKIVYCHGENPTQIKTKEVTMTAAGESIAIWTLVDLALIEQVQKTIRK